MSPQPPSRDRAGPAAVLAPTGTALVETAGDRGAAAVDVARASTELDPTIESVAGRTAGRSDTIDPDSAVATFTDVEVADAVVDAVAGAGIDVTVNGSSRSVERDERAVEHGTAALVPQEGDHAIQVAAYDQPGLARVLADRLVAAGYPAYVVEARLEADQVVFRVRMGPYPNLPAARAVGRRVRDEEGLDWYVVAGR